MQKLGELDISALKTKVAAITEADWSADQDRQKQFEAHTDTQTIKLVFDPDYRHENPTEYPAFEGFKLAIEPLQKHILNTYSRTFRQRKTIARHGSGYFIRVILTRLAAHSRIMPHVDNGLSLKCCHRIHMPIITNEACLFTVGATTRALKAGELWEINNRRVHAVENGSDGARVHLIMDYVQPGERVFDPDGPLTA